MQTKRNAPGRLLGKESGDRGLRAVLDEINRAQPRNRAEIARRVCLRLNWMNPAGQPQLMSARVGLLRLQRLGLIELPPPRNGNGNGRGLSRQQVLWPAEKSINWPVHELRGLRVVEVQEKAQSALWNGLMDRYHYRGYTPLAGAQRRYLIECDEGLLAAIGFGAAAWKLACRDQFIGWKDGGVRERYLHLILNNWRFLVLPWVRSRNLASRTLAICSRRLPADFEQVHGYRPALLESFVEGGRFAGTCYRAANWICVGQTRGRGKQDRRHSHCLPIKDIWLRPLVKNFRETLGVAN